MKTRIGLLCALLIGACTEGEDGNDEGAEPTGSTTEPGTGGTAGTAGTAGTGPGNGTDPPTEGSGSGDGVNCDPEDGDSECDACTKENCCDQLGACFADPICECMTECATGLNDIPMCTDMCGTSNAFSGLTSCVTISCASECI